MMITLFVDFQQDLYRITRNLKQRFPKQDGVILHCINLLNGLYNFWDDHYISLQGQDMTDVIGEILRLQSTLSPLKDNSKELYGLANIVFEQKKMVMENRIPVPKDYVRLYSPFTQDIHGDVPLDAFCDVPVNTKGLLESNHFLVSLWNEMNINLHPSKSLDEILSLYEAEDITNYDTYKLSCGHDVTYVIAYLIWKHISRERTNKDELEKLLRASYTIESFRNTDIYTALNQWSVGNDMAILK